MERSSLKTDVDKVVAWQERSRARARDRAAARRPVAGQPLSSLAPVSKRQLEGRVEGEVVPLSTLRSRPRRRTPDEAEIARAWHAVVCAGRLCVKAECDKPAGPFGHHALRKEWLARMGLAAHIWDVEVGVPPCEGHHEGHELASDPITRDELIATGKWQELVNWARTLDERYFAAGHEPVLARLERDYPEVPA